MPQNINPWSRRQFLNESIGFLSMTVTAPYFICKGAEASMLPKNSLISSRPGIPEERIFVVVQLGGGNDGLNTVVPYGDDEYHRKRPNIKIPNPNQNGGALVLDENKGIGLNPAFSDFKWLYDEGYASIYQGIGYPNPNRSHFSSMDIWHSGHTNKKTVGWLGRYFDNQCHGNPEADAAIAIGSEAPLALIGKHVQPVTYEREDLFKWAGKKLDKSLAKGYEKINSNDESHMKENSVHINSSNEANFLLRTSMNAQVTSQNIKKALGPKPLVSYPASDLASQLRVIASMIRGGLDTRVYYATMGGFDTHANQKGDHARKLKQVGESLKAFQQDINKQGNNKRVLTLVFSEFGRRVAENGSGGTDHGTAAPIFIIGDTIKPGIHGKHPSLKDLDQGDLKFNMDFRSIYQSILDDWLMCDAKKILGRKYKKQSILKV